MIGWLVAVVLALSPHTGERLYASNGMWSSRIFVPSVGIWITDAVRYFTYQWYRCNDGGQQCWPIHGAYYNSYRVQLSDKGYWLRFLVTGCNSAGCTNNLPASTWRVS